MEIRPDRFKAVAGKTLGKIHRYTHISNNPDSTSDFSLFSRVFWGRGVVFFYMMLQFIMLRVPIIFLPTTNYVVKESLFNSEFNRENRSWVEAPNITQGIV